MCIYIYIYEQIFLDHKSWSPLILSPREATFSIGTDATCALKVKGPLVSRSHAVVPWRSREARSGHGLKWWENDDDPLELGIYIYIYIHIKT